MDIFLCTYVLSSDDSEGPLRHSFQVACVGLIEEVKSFFSLGSVSSPVRYKERWQYLGLTVK